MEKDTSDGMLRRNRALRELLRLAREAIADGVVTAQEAAAFEGWIGDNPDMQGVWPVPSLARHLRRTLADGNFTPGEQEELLALLRDVAGVGGEEQYGKLNRESGG